MSDRLSLWELYNKQDEFTALLNTHNHDASNLTGFSNVAITGSFNDLKNIPDVVNSVNGKTGAVKLTNDDVNAIPKNASCNKNWNYMAKSGQPSYVWGCNDNLDMYIYNPSNFSVSYATTAGYATSATNSGSSNNSLKLEGYSLEQIKQLIKDEVKQNGGDIVGKDLKILGDFNVSAGQTWSYSNSKGGMIRLLYQQYTGSNMPKFKIVVDGVIITEGIYWNDLTNGGTIGSNFCDIPFTSQIDITNVIETSSLSYGKVLAYINK